jgi:hypothetical protein
LGGGFGLLAPRTAKNENATKHKTKTEKIGLGFLVELFVKTVQHDFFGNLLCSAFELPSLINTRTAIKRKKMFFLSICLGKVFDMDFL